MKRGAAGAAATLALALASTTARADKAGAPAKTPLLVAIRGAGSVTDPAVDAPTLIAGALGARLLALKEPTVEEVKGALGAADVVYLDVRMRGPDEAGGPGLALGRGQTISTRALAEAMSAPARLVLAGGSGAGAELLGLLDGQKTAVVGFSAPVVGRSADRIFVRLAQEMAACPATTGCASVREALAELEEPERPRVLAVGGRTALRASDLPREALGAPTQVALKGRVRTPSGDPARGILVEVPAVAGVTTNTDAHGGFVLTVPVPIRMSFRVASRTPRTRAVAVSDGGDQSRELVLELEDSADEAGALATRLEVTVPEQPPHAASDKQLTAELQELVAGYLREVRTLKFSLDDLAPILARFEQGLYRGARVNRTDGTPRGAGRQIELCDDAELRFLRGRILDLRETYEQRYARIRGIAAQLREIAQSAPHLAEKTDAAPVLAAARLLRRDHADNLRRLDAAVRAFREAGCRDTLLDVARPLYDLDVPADFADRLPGGSRPTGR